MDQILQAFLDSLNGIRSQANAMLAGLPPLEQHEAASEIGYGIRALTRYGNELVANAENLSKQMSGLVEGMKQKISATAEADLLAKGEYIRKTDADAAMTAALQTRETEVRQAFEAELVTKAAVAAKRDKLVADKILPAVAAERVSDEVLAGDGADAVVGVLTGRIAKLRELGLTPENAGKLVSEVASLPCDEAGETAFSTRLEGIRETVEAARGKGSAPAVNPLAGGGGSAADPATRTNRLI